MSLFSGCRKRKADLKGGSLHDGFGGSGEHLALLLLVLENTDTEATVTVLAGSVFIAVSVATAIPRKSKRGKRP